MRLSEARKEELTALCRDLIRIKSDSGCEGQMVEKLKRVFTEFGFESRVDRFGSITAHKKGRDGGPKLLFDGHIDNVPAQPSDWKHDPWGAEVENGKIYGRGASDMKGSVAAMICAAKYFAEDHPGFSGDLYLSCTVQEESFEGVAAGEVARAVQPDFVVIGEATELALNIGQRGRAEIVAEVFGRAAHSANPEKGINAVSLMCELLLELQKIPEVQDEFLGKGILVPTDIASKPYPGLSVVPEYCRVTFDRRLLTGETEESVLYPLQAAADSLAAKYPGASAKISYAYGEMPCYTGETIKGLRFFPAWKFGPEEEFVSAMRKSLQTAGLSAPISHYSFCTNASYFAGEAGIRTVGFGPSPENLAHIVDEYIELEQLTSACTGYSALSEAVLCR